MRILLSALTTTLFLTACEPAVNDPIEGTWRSACFESTDPTIPTGTGIIDELSFYSGTLTGELMAFSDLSCTTPTTINGLTTSDSGTYTIGEPVITASGKQANKVTFDNLQVGAGIMVIYRDGNKLYLTAWDTDPNRTYTIDSMLLFNLVE